MLSLDAKTFKIGNKSCTVIIKNPVGAILEMINGDYPFICQFFLTPTMLTVLILAGFGCQLKAFSTWIFLRLMPGVRHSELLRRPCIWLPRGGHYVAESSAILWPWSARLRLCLYPSCTATLRWPWFSPTVMLSVRDELIIYITPGKSHYTYDLNVTHLYGNSPIPTGQW